MSFPVYYIEQSDTLVHLFDSYAGSTGASVTLSGLAVTDIEIYKDGGTTQRASDAGYALLDTDGIDFDGTTGIHGFSIDLSDNTDAGFYAVGPWYHVVLASVTVDTQTVNKVVCAFRIVSATRGLAGTALPAAAADAAGGLVISDAGGLDIDAVGGAVTSGTHGNAALKTLIDTLQTDTSAILVDTGTTLDDFVDDLEGRITSALATVLQAHALAVGRLVVDAGSDTTSVVFKTVNGAAASAVDDHFNGRTIVFTSGALLLQACSISDYNGTTKTATVSALTSGPAEDVTGVTV